MGFLQPDRKPGESMLDAASRQYTVTGRATGNQNQELAFRIIIAAAVPFVLAIIAHPFMPTGHPLWPYVTVAAFLLGWALALGEQDERNPGEPTGEPRGPSDTFWWPLAIALIPMIAAGALCAYINIEGTRGVELATVTFPDNPFPTDTTIINTTGSTDPATTTAGGTTPTSGTTVAGTPDTVDPAATTTVAAPTTIAGETLYGAPVTGDQVTITSPAGNTWTLPKSTVIFAADAGIAWLYGNQPLSPIPGTVFQPPTATYPTVIPVAVSATEVITTDGTTLTSATLAVTYAVSSDPACTTADCSTKAVTVNVAITSPAAGALQVWNLTEQFTDL